MADGRMIKNNVHRLRCTFHLPSPIPGGEGVHRLFIVVIIALLMVGCENDAPPAGFVELEIGGKVFLLELALDSKATYQGLSDREEIAADGGMLFVFRNARTRSFVMRKCLVPIDIIFLDAGGRVVAMHEMQVQPYETSEGDLKAYSSKWPSGFVIELKGGTINGLGLQDGDAIEYDWRVLKAMAR